MKKFLSVVLSLFAIAVCLCLLDTSAQAAEVTASGTCGDNLTWMLDSDGTLTISGTGAMADYASASDAPWYSQRTLIASVVVQNGVTSIGDRAFYNCTSLTDVTIGGDVVAIGTYAFRGCTVLESVVIPSNVTELKSSAFRVCTALTVVALGGDAPTLGDYVFNEGAATLEVQYYEGAAGYDVAPWTDYTLSAQHVGQWIVDVAPTCTTDGSAHIDCTYCQETFSKILPGGHSYQCDTCSVCGEARVIASGTCGSKVRWKLDVFGLLTIYGKGAMSDYWGSSTSSWGGYRDSIASVKIESGVTIIGSYAFDGCSSLKSVTIPAGVTDIGSYAFRDCRNLTSITIPASVTSIGYYAFSGCSGLTSITIPDSVISIERYAFRGCSSLTAITIPDSVTSIGYAVFESCSGLTSVTIPDSVTSIDSYAFCGCSSLTAITIPFNVSSIGSYAFCSCSSLTSITIPEGVPSIGDNTFRSCSSLTSIVIPESVRSIGYYAFSECSGLTSITIAESVTSIGGYAFYSCSGLTSITIPESVTSIGDTAFGFCRSLTSITIPTRVTSIGNYAFSSCRSLTSITIPESVSSIGYSAFYYCGSLDTVFYKGTCQQAQDIQIEDYNEPLQSATWHYECVAVKLGQLDCIYCPECDAYFLPNGEKMLAPYYLVGFINEADYGCESDYENLGEYLFVDGKLVATFTEDSYVFIKTGDNRKWFMASEYTTGTSVILSDTSNGTQEKLFVPGGVELTFTLVVNEDESLTLSYKVGYTVSGTVTSFGDDSGGVTVELVADGTAIQTSNCASFSFSNVAPGSYVLRFSKKNHVTREYTIDVDSGDVTLDAMLCLNGDGKVNMKDWNRLYEHLSEINPLW